MRFSTRLVQLVAVAAVAPLVSAFPAVPRSDPQAGQIETRSDSGDNLLEQLSAAGILGDLGLGTLPVVGGVLGPVLDVVDGVAGTVIAVLKGLLPPEVLGTLKGALKPLEGVPLVGGLLNGLLGDLSVSNVLDTRKAAINALSSDSKLDAVKNVLLTMTQILASHTAALPNVLPTAVTNAPAPVVNAVQGVAGLAPLVPVREAFVAQSISPISQLTPVFNAASGVAAGSPMNAPAQVINNAVGPVAAAPGQIVSSAGQVAGSVGPAAPVAGPALGVASQAAAVPVQAASAAGQAAGSIPPSQLVGDKLVPVLPTSAIQSVAGAVPASAAPAALTRVAPTDALKGVVKAAPTDVPLALAGTVASAAPVSAASGVVNAASGVGPVALANSAVSSVAGVGPADVAKNIAGGTSPTDVAKGVISSAPTSSIVGTAGSVAPAPLNDVLKAVARDAPMSQDPFAVFQGAANYLVKQLPDIGRVADSVPAFSTVPPVGNNHYYQPVTSSAVKDAIAGGPTAVVDFASSVWPVDIVNDRVKNVAGAGPVDVVKPVVGKVDAAAPTDAPKGIANSLVSSAPTDVPVGVVNGVVSAAPTDVPKKAASGAVNVIGSVPSAVQGAAGALPTDALKKVLPTDKLASVFNTYGWPPYGHPPPPPNSLPPRATAAVVGGAKPCRYAPDCPYPPPPPPPNTIPPRATPVNPRNVAGGDAPYPPPGYPHRSSTQLKPRATDVSL